MGYVLKILGLQSGDFFSDYLLDANCLAGALALRSTSLASAGEVVDATATAAVDAIGLYSDTVQYNAAPVLGAGLNSPFGLLGGNELMGAVARIVNHPMQVCRFRVAGGATPGAGLAVSPTTPANILINSVADATKLIVTDNAAGAISMAGGLIKGRTGANGGQLRRLVTHTVGPPVDERVEVAFVNAIAVGDTFMRVPYSKAVQNVQLTTDLTEANGLIAVGTGAALKVVNVVLDETTDQAWVDVILADHWLNAT
jgi:hypothetical protein